MSLVLNKSGQVIQQLKRINLNQFRQVLQVFRRAQEKRFLQIKTQLKGVAIRNFVFLQAFLGISVGKKQISGHMSTEDTTKLNELVLHADQLFDENKYQETISLLKEYENQNLYEIKWRIARALYSQSKSETGKKSEELVREAFDYSKAALELNDTHFAGHKWYAVLLDAKSGLDGTKERISQLENFHKHLERALELNPQDATTWYILGEYYFGLADLNWMTRKIVAVVFANPPSATYEQALECYEKAEQMNPDFYSLNKFALGRTYLQLGNKEKAKEFLTKAYNVNVANEDDKKCKEEATKLLKKC
jgi:tetratricopeptide (TPR) repeat protein